MKYFPVIIHSNAHRHLNLKYKTSKRKTLKQFHQSCSLWVYRLVFRTKKIHSWRNTSFHEWVQHQQSTKDDQNESQLIYFNFLERSHQGHQARDRFQALRAPSINHSSLASDFLSQSQICIKY